MSVSFLLSLQELTNASQLARVFPYLVALVLLRPTDRSFEEEVELE